MTKSHETGAQTPEKKEMEPIKIESVTKVGEIKELSGLSLDSSHGSIDNTKALLVQVRFNRGVRFGGYISTEWEILVLVADIVPGQMGEEPSRRTGPDWHMTDFKVVELSGKHGTFAFVDQDLSGKNSDVTLKDDISELLGDAIIDDKGNLKV